MKHIKKIRSKINSLSHILLSLKKTHDTIVESNHTPSKVILPAEKGVITTNKIVAANTIASLSRKEYVINEDSFNYNVKKIVPVTIIIPAYNEESSISTSLASLSSQSVIPEQIIVVDDSSSDCTGEIARRFNRVKVIRTPINSGSKGHALNHGLPLATTKYIITMDADMTIEEDAVKKLYEYMENRHEISAACTFVLPKNTKTIWERTRFVEYLFALSFYKSVQQMYDGIIICSGCFAIYNTSDLKSIGGWPTETVAEDMELTFMFYKNGKRIGYDPNIFCFAIEPGNVRLMIKQIKRWSTGYFQVLKLNWKDIKKIPILREFIILGLVDTLVGIILNAFLISFTISHANPTKYLYFLALDVILLSIPTFWIAAKMGKVSQLVKTLPVYLICRYISYCGLFYALISVFVLRKGNIKFEKGHE
jgi:cellulose synthase/poly-beta-1,6-N-acetylglucosamine synthase-like glycosyltransferase